MCVMADMIGNREALDGIYLEATLSSLLFFLADINRCFLDILLMPCWKPMHADKQPQISNVTELNDNELLSPSRDKSHVSTTVMQQKKIGSMFPSLMASCVLLIILLVYFHMCQFFTFLLKIIEGKIKIMICIL